MSGDETESISKFHVDDVDPVGQPDSCLRSWDLEAVTPAELASLLFGLVEYHFVFSMPVVTTRVEIGSYPRLILPSNQFRVYFKCDDATPLRWQELIDDLKRLTVRDEEMVLLVTTRPFTKRSLKYLDTRRDLSYVAFGEGSDGEGIVV